MTILSTLRSELRYGLANARAAIRNPRLLVERARLFATYRRKTTLVLAAAIDVTLLSFMLAYLAGW